MLYFLIRKIFIFGKHDIPWKKENIQAIPPPNCFKVYLWVSPIRKYFYLSNINAIFTIEFVYTLKTSPTWVFQMVKLIFDTKFDQRSLRKELHLYRAINKNVLEIHPNI